MNIKIKRDAANFILVRLVKDTGESTPQYRH